jgi:tRNA nucleotidyltransferase (CCA-adding enzyme)
LTQEAVTAVQSLFSMFKPNTLTKFISSLPPLALKIIDSIDKNKGQSYLVGGAVRDLLLNKTINDIDIEVHNISEEKLATLLKEHGPLLLVGKQFGVFKLTNLRTIDWSLPRTDSTGRKPTVITNPTLGIEAALRRRDFTINALAINCNNLLSHSEKNIVIDPYGGVHDLEDKKLHYVDASKFPEDPLRIFRAMQFMGRFDLSASDELSALCKSMQINIPDQPATQIAQERITYEVIKMLKKSLVPSKGMIWIKSIGKEGAILPQLSNLSDQDFGQLCQELDVTQTLIQDPEIAPYLNSEQLLLAVVTHPLKRAIKCKIGAIVPHLILEKKILRNSCYLAQQSPLPHEEQPAQWYQLAAYYAARKRLPLVAILIAQAVTANADKSLLIKHIKAAHHYKVLVHALPPIVTGNDILELNTPEPLRRELLEKAYHYQIAHPQASKQDILQHLSSDQDERSVK